MSTFLLQTNQFSKLVIDLETIAEGEFSGQFIGYQEWRYLQVQIKENTK